MNNSEALMLLPTIIFLSLGKNIFEFLLITWTWWILPSIIFLLNRNILFDLIETLILLQYSAAGFMVGDISLSWMCFYMTRLLWSNIIDLSKNWCSFYLSKWIKLFESIHWHHYTAAEIHFNTNIINSIKSYSEEHN